MEFLYKYYYTFFVLHQQDVTKGRKSGPAWVAAMFQLSIGVSLLIMGLTGLVFYLSDSVEMTRGYSKLSVSLTFTVLPFSIVYYLLFHYYKVSKETGRTDNSDYEITRFWKIFFWIFWVVSCFAPIYISLVANGYGF